MRHKTCTLFNRLAATLHTTTSARNARRLTIRLCNRLAADGVLSTDKRLRALRKAARPVRWYAAHMDRCL